MASTRPGRPVELRPAGNAAELTVVDPAKQGHTVKRTAQDVFQFQDTSPIGRL